MKHKKYRTQRQSKKVDWSAKPIEVWILLSTVATAVLFLIFMPARVTLSGENVFSKWGAVGIAFAFTAFGALLYLLRDRMYQLSDKEKTRKGLKTVCHLLTCSGIVFLLVVLIVTASIDTPMSGTEKELNGRVVALEAEVSALRTEKETTQADTAERIGALENEISALRARLAEAESEAEASAELAARLTDLEAQLQAYEERISDLESRLPSDDVTKGLPDWWKSEVMASIEAVNAIRDEASGEIATFVWATDSHIPDNSAGQSSTEYLGRLMAAVMAGSDVPYALISGDIGTQNSLPSEEALMEAYSRIPLHLAPLWGTDRLLACVGNHDGCWGTSEGYYKHQLTPKKMKEFFFSPQQADSRRCFSEDGTYFYLDDPDQKIRYIVLNAQFGGEEYLSDGDGYAVHDRFATSCYGQRQLDWLADTALRVPEGYGIIIMTHVPPTPAYAVYTADQSQLIGMLTAFCNKSTFDGQITDGVDGWTNSHVQVDFSGAAGEIISVLSGHSHTDSVDTDTLPCPILTLSTAGGDLRNGSDRKIGTDTETAFDVVAVDRAARVIHCIRVGAGEDRVIRY